MIFCDREQTALWNIVLAGVLAAVLSGLLIADGVAEIGRAAEEEARIAMLEERVLTDADAASVLAAEQERRTQRSVRRQVRYRHLGKALVVATVLLLVAAKLRQSLRGEPVPVPASEATPARSMAETRVTGAGVSIRPTSATDEPSIDLAFVEAVVEREGPSREAAIAILQALQSHYRYLPEPALRKVCELTEIAPAQIMGVASFYAQFRRRPVGRHLVRVCHGTACHVAGIGPIMDELRRWLAIPPGDDTDPGRRFTLDPVNCLGCCSLAPVMMVDEEVAGKLTPTSACKALRVEDEA